MSLTTERIILRALDAYRDRTTLYVWENDTSSWSSSSTLNPISYKFIDEFILESTTDIIEKHQMSLMIESIADNSSIGYIQLFDYHPVDSRCAIGIYIAEKVRNRGYASEALSVVHRYLFERLRCTMVYASVLSGNLPSRRLFEHLGYRHTATLERWHWLDGMYQDLMYYQLWLK